MTMQSWILNEYVHVNEGENTDLGWWAEYEPFDHLAQASSLVGYIYLTKDGSTAPIHWGRNNWERNNILIGSDDVQYAGFLNNSIHLLWNKDPGEHYVCISYKVDIEQFESIIKFDWKQEGF